MQCLKHKLLLPQLSFRKRIVIPMCNKQKKQCYDWHNGIHRGWEGNFHRLHGRPMLQISSPVINYSTMNKFWGGKMRRPGIEPGSTAWKATMLTITPPTLWYRIKKHIVLLLTQLYNILLSLEKIWSNIF